MNYSSALAFCEKFAAGDYTAAEHAEFVAWLNTIPEKELGDMLDAFRAIAETPMPPETADPLLVARIEANLDRYGATESPLIYHTFIRFGAAAALLLLVAGAGWWILRPSKTTGIPVAQHNPPVQKDIPPGGDRAILTLADGSTVVLDGAQNGQVAQQGAAKIIKINGQVTYTDEGRETTPVYNSLATPRGGQYRLVLPDSTVVWLNSASSLRFPTRFTGPLREVELSGEGYFEVAKNKNHPFHVKTGDQFVEVLGTDFNIMAYGEESAIRTTLVTGSVRVEKGNARTLLSPGTQAVLFSGASSFQTVPADIETTLAWKNGRFEFDETELKTIMRQLERWYDIKVVYQGDVSAIVLSGSVSRRKSVTALLDILSQTKRFHFKIEDDVVTIMP